MKTTLGFCCCADANPHIMATANPSNPSQPRRLALVRLMRINDWPAAKAVRTAVQLGCPYPSMNSPPCIAIRRLSRVSSSIAPPVVTRWVYTNKALTPDGVLLGRGQVSRVPARRQLDLGRTPAPTHELGPNTTRGGLSRVRAVAGGNICALMT